MQNIALRAHGARAPTPARNAYALRCSLIGAATGLCVGVLLVSSVLHFDVASLGSLLTRVMTPMVPTDLAILPAVFAAIGFAVGPALGGEPAPTPDD